jgi:cardiolipin synthase A/B
MAHGLPRRHQHQQRLLRRLVQPVLAANPESDGSLAWRDTDLQLQGPVVAEFQKSVPRRLGKPEGRAAGREELLSRRPRIAGREVVRAIGSSPDEPFSLIYATLLSAIGSAETSVHLTNAYFAPTRSCSPRSKPPSGAAST